MGNKLVYIGGVPYWMTPEGDFVVVELKDGLPVEHIVVKQK